MTQSEVAPLDKYAVAVLVITCTVEVVVFVTKIGASVVQAASAVSVVWPPAPTREMVTTSVVVVVVVAVVVLGEHSEVNI